MYYAAIFLSPKHSTCDYNSSTTSPITERRHMNAECMRSLWLRPIPISYIPEPMEQKKIIFWIAVRIVPVRI